MGFIHTTTLRVKSFMSFNCLEAKSCCRAVHHWLCWCGWCIIEMYATVCVYSDTVLFSQSFHWCCQKLMKIWQFWSSRKLEWAQCQCKRYLLDEFLKKASILVSCRWIGIFPCRIQGSISLPHEDEVKILKNYC